MPSLDIHKSSEKKLHGKLSSLVNRMLELVSKRHKATNDSERKTLEKAVLGTDHAIDKFVYQLYGLTAEEIALVEQSFEDKGAT